MSIPTENRDLPLKQPSGWRPRFPRWMLQLPSNISQLCIYYIGVQAQLGFDGTATHGLKPHMSEQQTQAVKNVENWLSSKCGNLSPKLWEKFYVETGYDLPDTVVWVLYWLRPSDADNALRLLDLQGLSHLFPDIGFWRESFNVPRDRFETIYSGPDYQPGVASLEGSSQVPHNFTGYWGAARDRLPASAWDTFRKQQSWGTPNTQKSTRGRVFAGRNDDVILHIRSGQWWERCSDEEREAYESKLEPILRRGMKYVEDNPTESGDFGLRFMRNLTTNESRHAEEVEPILGRQRRETCSAGFFRSLVDLEKWASGHPTHHSIFHGIHQHALQFGQTKFKFRSWHEVCILKPGEVSFEYVNCEPRTGLLPFIQLPAPSQFC